MSAHNLVPLPYGRFYCGPAAISSFTGLHPKDDLREIINRARGFRDSQGVIGMSNELVEKVLNELGMKISGFVNVEQRQVLNGLIRGHYYHSYRVMPTLKQWCEAAATWQNAIVNVRSHYIAVSNGYAQDNKSGAPYRVDLFTGARSKVLRVCYIYGRKDQ